MRAVASGMPKIEHKEVFLVRAIRTLASGGTTARNAWGRMTFCIVCAEVRPTERAASAWPSGIELTPARSASHTKVEVYIVSARTFIQK